jgi:ubiquitin-conjugating enzyme E2 J2
MGLYSFMLETAPTLGGIPTTTAEKRRYAADSLKFNCKDSTFRELFPELVRLYEDRTATNLASRASGNTDSNGSGSCGGEVAVRGAEIPGTDGLGGLVMTVSIVVAVGLLAVIFHIGEWNL